MVGKFAQATIRVLAACEFPRFRGAHRTTYMYRALRLLSATARRRGFGQPTHETRPHLLAPGEITPGISATEYFERRMVLASKLPLRSMAVIVGHQVQYASGPVFYEFQQNNNLFYLTGWLEPDSVAVIERTGSGGDEDVVLHMLVPEREPALELWEGARSGTEGAYGVFNADETAPIDQVDKYLAKLIGRNRHVFYDPPARQKGPLLFFASQDPTSGIQRVLEQHGSTVHPLGRLLAQQRAVKSAAEIAVMARAGTASSAAIDKCMEQTRELATENDLSKLLEYQFVRHGCDKHAYVPVVASGANALTIHYTRNDDVLKPNQMVFVDAGGKLGGYCADISRAWPVGEFSQPQRDIYSAVLATNKAIISQCAPGVSLQELHNRSVELLCQELRNLPGFSLVTQGQVATKLYPHYVGHHLGLDLHDVPSVSRHQDLVLGNVVTVEPGLYIPESSKWPKWYHGIGVRIEDNVAITPTGHQVLTNAAKELADIDRLTG